MALSLSASALKIIWNLDFSVSMQFEERRGRINMEGMRIRRTDMFLKSCIKKRHEHGIRLEKKTNQQVKIRIKPGVEGNEHSHRKRRWEVWWHQFYMILTHFCRMVSGFRSSWQSGQRRNWESFIWTWENWHRHLTSPGFLFAVALKGLPWENRGEILKISTKVLSN